MHSPTEYGKRKMGKYIPALRKRSYSQLVVSSSDSTHARGSSRVESGDAAAFLEAEEMRPMDKTSLEIQLEQDADKFLRKKGFRRDGRKRGEVGRGQARFEERARPNPFGHTR